MKIRDQAIKEINSMTPSEIFLIHELIGALKNRRSQISDKRDIKPYEKVQEALKSCSGSFSDQIISERADRS